MNKKNQHIKSRQSDIFKLFNKQVKNNIIKYVCKYCSWKTSANATRMVLHITNKCKSASQNIKDLFKPSFPSSKRYGYASSSSSTVSLKDSDINSNYNYPQSMSIGREPNDLESERDEDEPQNSQDIIDEHHTHHSDGLSITPTIPNIFSGEANQCIHADTDRNLRPESTHSNTMSVSMTSFVDIVTNQQQDQLESSFARFVYSNQLPLSITENQFTVSHYREMRPGFKLPSRFKLSNKLLDAEYKTVHQAAFKKLSYAYALGISGDGWTNIKRDSIINLVITTPEPVFYKSIYCKSNRHTAAYISNIFINAIEDIGSNKFTALVTDNAKNMKAAWAIIKSKFPHISCYGCVAHGLNLLIKDLVKLQPLADIVDTTKNIIKEIRNSLVLTAVLKEKQTTSGESVTLKLPVITRWGSNVDSLESLLKNKSNLKKLCIDDRVQNDISEESHRFLLSENFWNKIETFYSLLKPIAVHIKKIEGDKPQISKVCEIFKNIESSLEQSFKDNVLPVLSQHQDEIFTLFNQRREFCIRDIHLAANLLDPATNGNSLKRGEEITAIKFILSFGETFSEINKEQLLEELSAYRAREDLFQEQFIWDASKDITCLGWWKAFCCSAVPNLYNVALKILGAPPTSASVERSFSKCSNIQDAKKNRLTNDRMEKLLFVSENIKFLSPSEAKNISIKTKYDKIISKKRISEATAKLQPNPSQLNSRTISGVAAIAEPSRQPTTSAQISDNNDNIDNNHEESASAREELEEEREVDVLEEIQIIVDDDDYADASDFDYEYLSHENDDETDEDFVSD